MFLAEAIESNKLRLRKCYEYLDEMSVAGKLMLSFLMAISLGVLAQLRVFLPWTPVPVVMIQLGIMTFPVVMGRKWGVVPVAMYVILGLAGIPWFSNFGSGLSYVLGPTGGYLIGYILSAWFLSSLATREKNTKNVFILFGIVWISQLVIIFVPGLVQLNLWMKTVATEAVSFNKLLMMGFYPFVIADTVKSLIGTLIIYSTAKK